MIDYSFSILELEYFLLIFTRISCFVFIVPFFSMKNTPARIRIGISFFTAILLFQVMTPSEMPVYNTVLEYAVMVVKEAITGLLIGFSANMCTSILNFAGTVADMEIGFSMVTLFDPATRENSSISGVFYQQVFMLMLIATGMYRFLLSALADTFAVIPINGAVFHGDRLVTVMLEFLGEYIVIGFRIVLPVFCSMLLLNAVLGVLAKVAPQMNMFAVGMQLKILVGLSILFLTVGLLPGAADFVFEEMQKMLAAFVGALQ